MRSRYYLDLFSTVKFGSAFLQIAVAIFLDNPPEWDEFHQPYTDHFVFENQNGYINRVAQFGTFVLIHAPAQPFAYTMD